MELLGMFYCGLGILVMLGLALLFWVKDEKSNNIIISIVTVISVLTVLLSISSMPSNEVLEKVIAGIIGIVSVIGCVIRFRCKDYSFIPKLLIAVSLVGTYIFMLA